MRTSSAAMCAEPGIRNVASDMKHMQGLRHSPCLILSDVLPFEIAHDISSGATGCLVIWSLGDWKLL